MPETSFEQIISDISERNFKPIYLLMGEEPYFIDRVSDLLQQTVLDESQKPFNLNILYGRDQDAAQVDNLARRFPMGADYNLVIVKEAQMLQKIDNLIYYVRNPLKSTILVLCYKNGNLDKRLKLFKEIEKGGVLLATKKLYEDKVPRWISAYLARKNYQIEPAAAMILTEYMGTDLARVAGELDKLVLTLPDGQSRITTSHIEENSGISKDYNTFELVKALSKRNILKANRIVNYFAANQKNYPITLTIGTLYYFFGKLLALHFLPDKSTRSVTSALQVNSYFVQDYLTAIQHFPRKKVAQVISLLREYDLKSKGFGNGSTDEGELLKELIFKILH
jgi:DNA polymerase-3 subunit delta